MFLCCGSLLCRELLLPRVFFGFGCPEAIHQIMALNKERYPAMTQESKLEAGTRILVPDCIAAVLRNGSAPSSKQPASSTGSSLSAHRAIFGACSVCDKGPLKPGHTNTLECASLGCGARVHRHCDAGNIREGSHYFCPSCMAVPLETELFTTDFKETKFTGQMRFGTSSATARVATFGIVNSRSATKGITMSAQSAGVESERMILKLCAYVKANCPDLKFTSFVVNLNTKFPLHIDTENIGLGAIAGFGDYEGGLLWTHWLPEEAGKARENKTRFHDIKDKILVINGAAPHMTTKFVGRRLTVVFYCRKSWEACDPASLAHLKILGFQLPDVAYMEKWLTFDNGNEEYRLLAAIKDLVKDKIICGSKYRF